MFLIFNPHILFPDWNTPIILTGPGKLIDIDIKILALQIKTESVLGSGDEMWVRFVEHSSDNYSPGFAVEFQDPPLYRIGHCLNPVSFTMPRIGKLIWTVTKTESTLKLQCNGVKIFEYEFAESSHELCTEKWSLDEARYTRFHPSDTASLSYRAFPKGIIYSRAVENTRQSATMMKLYLLWGDLKLVF